MLRISARVKHYRELYKEKLCQVMHPTVAVRKVKASFMFSHEKPFGLDNYIYPFGNKEWNQKKLLEDVESGKIVLLEYPKASFGIVNDGGSVSHLLDSRFRAQLEWIQLHGESRPMFGCGTSQPAARAELPPEEVEEVPVAQTVPKIKFVLGWAHCKKTQPKSELLLSLLSGKYQGEKRALQEKHNEHLQDIVRKGEIVVLLSKEPETDPTTEKWTPS